MWLTENWPIKSNYRNCNGGRLSQIPSCLLLICIILPLYLLGIVVIFCSLNIDTQFEKKLCTFQI